MKINASLSDIKTVKVSTKKANGRTYASVNIPSDIVRRYDLKRGDYIIIAYLCREGEDCKVNRNDEG